MTRPCRTARESQLLFWDSVGSFHRTPERTLDTAQHLRFLSKAPFPPVSSAEILFSLASRHQQSARHSLQFNVLRVTRTQIEPTPKHEAFIRPTPPLRCSLRYVLILKRPGSPKFAPGCSSCTRRRPATSAWRDTLGMRLRQSPSRTSSRADMCSVTSEFFLLIRNGPISSVSGVCRI